MQSSRVSGLLAGGGSVARSDALGVLRVGPQSAGADPGPACYRRGGTLPTLTDANLVLGLYDSEHFLGGRMRLGLQESWRIGADAKERVSQFRAGRPL